MATNRNLTALRAFGKGSKIFIPHMAKGQGELRLWKLSGRVRGTFANSWHRLHLLMKSKVSANSIWHVPLWLPGSVPWYEGYRFLHVALAWHSLLVSCLGIWVRVLLTLFWIAHHQGWRSSWPSFSGIGLHFCLMVTPPKLRNSCRGSSNLVPSPILPWPLWCLWLEPRVSPGWWFWDVWSFWCWSTWRVSLFKCCFLLECGASQSNQNHQ